MADNVHELEEKMACLAAELGATQYALIAVLSLLSHQNPMTQERLTQRINDLLVFFDKESERQRLAGVQGNPAHFASDALRDFLIAVERNVL